MSGHHHFNIFIAEKYGIHEAIMIDNFVFWTKTNAAKGKNLHEGRYWSYGKPEFFQKYFTYMTERRIKTILQNCIKKGILIKGNFNKNAYDRTCWYSLSDNVLNELNLDITCSKPMARAIIQNMAMDKTKCGNGLDANRPTIPDTKTDTKTKREGKPSSLASQELKSNPKTQNPKPKLIEKKKQQPKLQHQNIADVWNKVMTTGESKNGPVIKLAKVKEINKARTALINRFINDNGDIEPNNLPDYFFDILNHIKNNFQDTIYKSKSGWRCNFEFILRHYRKFIIEDELEYNEDKR